MKDMESPATETLEPGSAITDEIRLAAIEAQLDKLFRHAGDGHETRALYRAVIDYRMENRK